MKKFTLLAVIVSLNASLATASDYSGNINLSVGHRELSSSDWEGDKSLNSLGIMTNFKEASWPVSIALDASLSISEDLSEDNDEVSISEYHLGLRKHWNIAPLNLNPYVGGGLAIAFASLNEEVDGKKENDLDRSIGAWFGVGANWNLVDKINIGADIRYSEADFRVHDKDFDTTGISSAISIGYSW